MDGCVVASVDLYSVKKFWYAKGVIDRSLSNGDGGEVTF